MNNDYYVEGNTVHIIINRRDGSKLEALIDKVDLDRVLSLPTSFYATKTKYGFYVKMDWEYKGQRNRIQLHRWLLGAKEGEVVDHKDGNTLDNRKSNLRLVTQLENSQNQKPKSNKTGYKGVYLNKATGRYYGQVVYNYRTYRAGTFDTPEECNEAVIELRKKLHPYATDRAF